MTKKHFEAFAEAIKETNFDTPSDKIDFIRSLSSVMKESNSRFDKRRFVKACYSEDEFESKSQMRRITCQV